MSDRQDNFEILWALRHDVTAESLKQCRFETKEGYRLPEMASHFRTYCDTLDQAGLYERRAENVVSIQPLSDRTEFVLPDEKFNSFTALLEDNPVSENKTLQDFLSRKSQFEE